MKRIPIISTIPSTVGAITAALSGHKTLSPIHVTTIEEAISVLRYELPEIKIIDFRDPAIDAQKCFEIIKSDPWLLFGGVIAIVDKNSEKIDMEQKKDPNFLLVTSRKDFEDHASLIVKILTEQSNFLLNRRQRVDLTSSEHGQFVSETDPFEIVFYPNLLGTYLYNSNRIDELGRMAFQSACMELLLNAVEHGNCEITYEEKSKWLEQGNNILDLIRIKRNNPEVCKKKVYITYDINPERTRVTIADDGKGFDWKNRLEGEMQVGLHGMGMKMTQSMVQNMHYNDLGNEVTFEIQNQKNVANFTPAILKSQQVLSFRHMQLVCREDEDTSDLFYISSGLYAVYVDNKLITTLSPADIFIGELAFLLNDRRSATVVSIGEGTLIKLDKAKFRNLIERHPHYGIFLARLVGQRLYRQNKDLARLKTELQDNKEPEN